MEERRRIEEINGVYEGRMGRKYIEGMGKKKGRRLLRDGGRRR